jgi:hypothetical protein
MLVPDNPSTRTFQTTCRSVGHQLCPQARKPHNWSCTCRALDSCCMPQHAQPACPSMHSLHAPARYKRNIQQPWCALPPTDPYHNLPATGPSPNPAPDRPRPNSAPDRPRPNPALDRPNTDLEHSLFMRKQQSSVSPWQLQLLTDADTTFVGCGLRLTSAHPNNFPAQTVLECIAQREGTPALLKTACVDCPCHDAS